MKPVLHPMTIASLAMYLALVGLSLLDVELLYLFWPYPLLLSLQKWVEPDSMVSYVAGCILGLFLVSGWSGLMLRILERTARRRESLLVGVLIASAAAWLIPFLVGANINITYGVTCMVEVVVLGVVVYLLSASALVGWSRVRALGALSTSVALSSWYVPLFALQAATLGIALAAGWPVGE